MGYGHSHGSPRPASGSGGSAFGRRPAVVTVAIYRGSTLVRRIWTNRSLASGTYGWTWSGKTAAGAYVKPGTYKVVVDATSWIGWSRFDRSVTVKSP